MASRSAVLYFLVSLLQSAVVPTHAMIPSVEDYFTDLGGDLTRLEWLHAVNSRSLLDQALKDTRVHMLEADVVYGTLLDGSGPMPVMAHPPDNTSDLSLQDFVEAIIQTQASNKKGIKLDFKFDEAYNASWAVLDPLRIKVTFPVWLNADILHGPGNSTATPLDWRNFVTSARTHLPDAPLSLGWTTAYEDGLSYSDQMLEDMKNVVEEEKVTQPITLAVRAAFAALSEKGIADLVTAIDTYQKMNKTTLTIWMSTPTDVVDIEKLRSLITKMGKSRVALDVPADVRKQLLGNGSSVSTTMGSYFIAALSVITATFNRATNLF